ncbi:MAG TPA: MarR family transcriptional regulator [Ktedonobacterales bacterium]
MASDKSSSIPEPDDELTPTQEFAWLGLLAACDSIVHQVDARLRAAHALSLSAYRVLWRLALAPTASICMSELAATVPITISGMSRLVDRLEEAGLVRRTSNREDGRFACAALTSDGLALVQTAHVTYVATLRRLFLDHLNDEELTCLTSCWRSLEQRKSRM